ncbi:C-type lectin lectoxin-Thr1-like isoform 1-T2 [Polymixia lowei]
MKFVSLLVMMSLLGTNIAVTFRRGDNDMPLKPGLDIEEDDEEMRMIEEQKEEQDEGKCEMPRACSLNAYKDWYRMGSYCIKYFRTPQNFSNAEMNCRSAAPGGHLVSVHNSEQNSNLLCVVMKFNAHKPRIWMGGFELFQSGRYVWTDASSWNFQAWTPGEPTNRWNNKEDCVEMNWSKIGKWNDHSCHLDKPYVCSFKNRV